MRLSEAIRLGAMLRPQAYGPDGQDGSCALRAACEAIGKPFTFHILATHFAATHRMGATCPVCSMTWGFLTGCVGHLNDEHRWSREAIADWVATVEPAEVSEVAPAAGPVRRVEEVLS